jgi:hypothetical protein
VANLTKNQPKRPLKKLAEPQRPETERIIIPRERRKDPIPFARISARLAHLFTTHKLAAFGDLHGLSFEEFYKFRNCGAATFDELLQLLETLETGKQPLQVSQSGAILVDPVKGDCFFVPPEARDLDPYALPLPARTETALRELGVGRLGQLHGVPTHAFQEVRSCGRTTVKKMLALLERIMAGEFRVPAEPFATGQTGAMLESLETMVAKLSPRERQMIELRLGAKEKKIWTLERIGSKFNLTRERVRQVVDDMIGLLRKEGGPVLTSQLKGVEDLCKTKVCPVTPELLTQWLGANARSLKYPLAFYVRLMGELNPEIPAWPEGQKPSVILPVRLRKTVKTIEKILQGRGEFVPFKKLCQSTRERLANLGLVQFLTGLKLAKSIVVQFPAPDQGEARLKR